MPHVDALSFLLQGLPGVFAILQFPKEEQLVLGGGWQKELKLTKNVTGQARGPSKSKSKSKSKSRSKSKSKSKST